jgi:hypothetical protein
MPKAGLRPAFVLAGKQQRRPQRLTHYELSADSNICRVARFGCDLRGQAVETFGFGRPSSLAFLSFVNATSQ